MEWQRNEEGLHDGVSWVLFHAPFLLTHGGGGNYLPKQPYGMMDPSDVAAARQVLRKVSVEA